MPSDFDRKAAETIRPHMEKLLKERKAKMAQKMANHNFKAEMHNWNERQKRFNKNLGN